MRSKALFSAICIFFVSLSYAQNVGIGTATPGSKAAVNGNLSVGASYSSAAAPANGAIIQGNVGIGTASPGYTLDVNGVVNSATGFNVGSSPAAAGSYLRGNGTNFVIGTIQSSDLPATIASNTTGTAASVTTNANLTGPITSIGNATSVASQTGTGSTFVMNTSPVLVTPNIGVATGTSLNLSSTATIGSTVTLSALNTAGIVTNTGAGVLGTTSIIPVANGGTGSATQNWVDLTTAQAAAGAKTWSANAAFTSGTASSNTTTGTIVVTGGVGISGALNVGGTAIIAGQASIGSGNSPGTSAVLDLTNSNTLGLQLPAITSSTPATPTAGMMVYNSTTGCMQYYNGSSWVNISSTPSTPVITGYTTVAHNQTSVSYAIASPSSGTTYAWTISGAGKFGGTATTATGTTVSVTFTGTLGTSTTSTINVSATYCGATVSSVPFVVTNGGNYYSTTANSSAVTWPTSLTNWGVNSFFVQMWGGGGSGGDYGAGGGGGYVEGTITTSSPSTTLFNTWVGGPGVYGSLAAGGIGYGNGGAAAYASGGYVGGSGGGASAIGINGGAVIAVAAGGGGGGGYEKNDYAAGGGGGNTTSTGGGVDDVNGLRANANTSSAGGGTSATGVGGGGAVIWTAASCGCTPGNPGVGANGGPGNTATGNAYAGGGGGGGYYGGGSGASSNNSGHSMGGGGGGTSLYSAFSSGGVTFVNGANTNYGASTTSGGNTYSNPGYQGTNYITNVGLGGGDNPSVGLVGEIYISY